MTPSPILDQVYANQKQPLPSSASPTTSPDTEPVEPATEGLPNPDGETMLLSQANGKKLTQALDLPQLEVELERAIWQVEEAIKKKSAQEASNMSAATPPTKETEEAVSSTEKKSQ
jgi:hypothetical protein